MKIYVKSHTNVVATKSKLNSLDEVLQIASKCPVACISAVTRKNQDNPKLRAADTDKLEVDVSAYDYIAVNGGWVNPEDGTQNTEESFIVIGPEYSKGEDEAEAFAEYMIDLCGKYDQWAILYISEVGDYVKQNKADAYSVFSNPKYIDPAMRSKFDSDEDYDDYINDEQRAYDDISRQEALDMRELYAVYYDRSGNIIKEFHNVSNKQLGAYFTALGRNIGAKQFTLLSSMKIRGHYIAGSLGQKFEMSSSRTAQSRKVSLLAAHKASQRRQAIGVTRVNNLLL